MQNDEFVFHARGRASVALKHFAITPSDGADLPDRPQALYCVTAGTAILRDGRGVELSYSLAAGEVLPISPVRVLATGTTAVLYGWI